MYMGREDWKEREAYQKVTKLVTNNYKEGAMLCPNAMYLSPVQVGDTRPLQRVLFFNGKTYKLCYFEEQAHISLLSVLMLNSK